MTRLQLLSSFLTERLAAVVKEVLAAVEDTVGEYREEAAQARRESEALRRQLREAVEAESRWLKSGRSGSAEPAPEHLVLHLEEPDSTLHHLRTPSLSDATATHFLPRDAPAQALDGHQEAPVRSPCQVRLTSAAHVKAEPEEHTLTPPAGQEVQTRTSVLFVHGDGAKVGVRGGASPAGATPPQHPVKQEALEAVRSPPPGDKEVGTQWTGPVVDRNSPDSEDDVPPGAAPRCARCGEAFVHAAALRLHLEQKRKLYACDWCCKSFAQSADLRRHLRTHTGERPHRCGVCAKSFSQRGNLRRHLRIHTGERPYSCPHCCRRFSDSDTMKKHKRTHSGERPYRCGRCSRPFTRASGLQVHLRRDLCFRVDT